MGARRTRSSVPCSIFALRPESSHSRWKPSRDSNMAKLKRIIRKVAPASSGAFDDQFWPVLVAFIVLGAFLEGAALGYLRFDDPRWWANRLLVMAAIPVVLGIGVAATLLVNSRMVKRAMQLAIVASITIHV